jgi:hypothetical protein
MQNNAAPRFGRCLIVFTFLIMDGALSIYKLDYSLLLSLRRISIDVILAKNFRSVSASIIHAQSRTNNSKLIMRTSLIMHGEIHGIHTLLLARSLMMGGLDVTPGTARFPAPFPLNKIFYKFFTHPTPDCAYA